MNKQPIPKLFQGEVMTCCVCGAQEKSDVGKQSNWTALELGAGDTKAVFYVCPNELPGPGGKVAEFELAYKRVLGVAMEKFKAATGVAVVERKCRVCGCTQNAPCIVDGTPCHWVAEDLCSSCVGAAVRAGLKLNDRDLRHLSQVLPFDARMDGVSAFQLLGALQLVCRHPSFTGPSRETAERFARRLQERVSVTENLAVIAAAGWLPQADVPLDGPT